MSVIRFNLKLFNIYFFIIFIIFLFNNLRLYLYQQGAYIRIGVINYLDDILKGDGR